ncbi:DNA ligase D [Lysinibacillus sp. FSL M8-0216]|uniref:DNA ligase (ATP) n=1 Tax=Lysinibacillus fusiformis TaxID=28031 RepID=A0A1H9R4F0_9BACI|nr:DNA ligase D [Lysinibacillus fusiformis]SCY73279.1 bifunctional non-homologous end joining protein LigD [Lysinibacillus fusiformis]SEO30561.1 bifunctional non-homologous end joining protein LigD [Lysinibacillus fusiformis]SER66929.1 bifunctional non-homologous end joining protein LigD [Lysinibacillus fusiformis]
MKPMLLTETNDIPLGDEWLYETKYDGFRCLLLWDEQPMLISRNGRNLNHSFPEIIEYCHQIYTSVKAFLPLTFDGELVYLNNSYKSEFLVVQQRGRMQNQDVIAKHAQAFPMRLLVFDVLTLKGESFSNRYLKTRKEQLARLAAKVKLPNVDYEDRSAIQIVQASEESKILWQAIKVYNGEGMVAKKRTSKWLDNTRSSHWLKIKNWRYVSVIVTQYDHSNGYFQGSIYDEGHLREVVTFKHGMKEEEHQTLVAFFQAQGQRKKELWTLAPSICVDIACIDFDGSKLREPKFHAFRLELSPYSCQWQHMQRQLFPIPETVPITHPDKPVWPEIGVTKDHYLSYLQSVSPYLLPFLQDRPLTVIRYPHGVPGESFYQKSRPDKLPNFVATAMMDEIDYIVCNNLETLLWLGNQLALELHIPFQTRQTMYPTEIVFDLDPPSTDHFSLAIAGALDLKEIIDYFQLQSFVKTSGGKGLQLYIPLPANKFTYEEVRVFTEFVCRFLCQQKPHLYTIERLKKNRHNKLYLDYVQHAEGKTIIAPYSTRGNELGLVATPLHWEEVNDDLKPYYFSIPAVMERMKQISNPFKYFREVGEQQDFQVVLERLKE